MRSTVTLSASCFLRTRRCSGFIPLALVLLGCDPSEVADEAPDVAPGAVDEPPAADGDGPGLLDDELTTHDPQALGVVASDVRSTRLNTTTGVLDGVSVIDQPTLSFDRTGVTWMRTVAFGTTRYLMRMSAQSGSVRVHVLNADNTLGAQTGSYNFAKTWTGAEIVAHGFTNYLYLLNADTGELRRHVFNSNGTINTTVDQTVTSDDWKDIALFDSYRIGVTGYLVGIDPWNARHRIYKGDLTNVTGSNWTRGWTSIDNTVIGSSAYVLTYKSAGDPYADGGDTSQIGRIAVQEVDTAGAHTLLSDTNIPGGFTSVLFVPVPGSTTHRILAYNATTGEYRLYNFSTATGLGAQIGAAQFTDTHVTDLETYATSTETFILQIAEQSDGQVIDPTKAEKIGNCVHSSLGTDVVGYQFGVIQHGRVVYRRAWGNAQLSPAVVPMTIRTPLDLGSGSKVVTAMTVLELDERGFIDIDDPLASMLDPSYLPPNASPNQWVMGITPRDLMMMQSGLDSSFGGVGSCVGTGLLTDCTSFFAASQNVPSAPCGAPPGLGSTECQQSYENANFGALREVIEAATGVDETPDVDQVTKTLWQNTAQLGEMSCAADDDVFYFSAPGSTCTPNGTSCVSFGGQTRNQGRFNVSPNPWDVSCGAGGWHASLQQMLRFLAAAQHQKVLGPTKSDVLLDNTLTDGIGGRSAVGWNAPVQRTGVGGPFVALEKVGGRGSTWMTNTYQGVFPDSVGMVLLINTRAPTNTAGGNAQILTSVNAYQYGTGQVGSCTDGWF